MKLLCILLGVSLFVAANAGLEEEGNEFEGDIILTDEQRMLIDGGKDLALAGSMQRGASRSGRWPGGVVPYTIDGSLARNSKATNAIASAMREWTQKTCITFKKRTTESGYVNFQVGSGCSSNVGRTGSRQAINLADGCWYHGTVVHEIGHALGFWHEQSRPDRDNYVTIQWNNIWDHTKHNFNKHGDSRIDSLGVPYDYGSIMHYGARAFSKNGRDTIVPRNGARIGQRSRLSAYDAQQMNLMYRCGSGGGGGGPAPSCTDTKSYCRQYRYYCRTKDYMKKYCRKTCGFC